MKNHSYKNLKLYLVLLAIILLLLGCSTTDGAILQQDQPNYVTATEIQEPAREIPDTGPEQGSGEIANTPLPLPVAEEKPSDENNPVGGDLEVQNLVSTSVSFEDEGDLASGQLVSPENPTDFGLPEPYATQGGVSNDNAQQVVEEEPLLVEAPVSENQFNPIPIEMGEEIPETVELPFQSIDLTTEPPVTVGYRAFSYLPLIKRFPMYSALLILILFFVPLVLSIVFVRKVGQAKKRIRDLQVPDIESALRKLKDLHQDILEVEEEIEDLKSSKSALTGDEWRLRQENQKLDTKLENQKQKLARTKELYVAIQHAVDRFHTTDIPPAYYRPLTEEEIVDLDSIAPSVMLSLNLMNYQDLRKEFRANQKQIDQLLEGYAERYTTKANQAIYKLMVISLRSELQNILYNLKFEKLDAALFQVRTLIAKYLVIVSDGNQQIAGTMRKFIGELEHLFENSVKIEYEYYIKREQAREEQLALRQQMREEAEERKRLKEQEKQIALEESKYQAEIEKVQQALAQEPLDSPRRVELETRVDALHGQLALVEEKKDEITRLQNGKAGNVYIISNLGSFGDNVFKIGMTRRLEPQERVDELGSASVPFKFDVHSFIFSEDAVGLENAIHTRLHSKRLNKVNLRKEFFSVSLDELEQLVLEINPTAEFNRTMLAEDYKQSLSLVDTVIPMKEEGEDEDGDTEENEQEEELA
ncbi:GIY-YIG nuclease family protein [Sphaerochaeta sp. PS]|uniref:GIY-YIG nuclease family protein n=1 Tax=Sphaerochaeta sp. PS TaxID=3076336 RepID=UPI0028A4286B|nr:GIY-YIG nuclease family protein [Sphaerochaeta sp. PS]MDT4761366.1 GIY-YIG nuclease family protein [Sphaerochaeta sp. PS]